MNSRWAQYWKGIFKYRPNQRFVCNRFCSSGISTLEMCSIVLLDGHVEARGIPLLGDGIILQ